MITVQPWDPSLLAVIEKVIRSSELGLNPVNDGKILKVPIPPLTEERRKELVKHLHKAMENHRTAVRNIRRDSNEELKKLLKDKKISEDDERRGLEEDSKADRRLHGEAGEPGEEQGAGNYGDALEIYIELPSSLLTVFHLFC